MYIHCVTGTEEGDVQGEVALDALRVHGGRDERDLNE